MIAFEYGIDNGVRVLLGLTPDETTEFELLDARIPFHSKPIWPDTANTPIEERWLELFTKHEFAKRAPYRRFRRSASVESRAA